MLKPLRKLFAAPESTPAHQTYLALVARARNSFFYTELGVPDTLDGRFELILLHLFLLQHRLMQSGSKTANEEFSRQLSEMFFADMDSSVRELGVSDSGVRYRIKAMAKAYHGRLQAYTAALDSNELLQAALARNLYGTLEFGTADLLASAARYVRQMVAALSAVDNGALLSGKFQWPVI